LDRNNALSVKFIVDEVALPRSQISIRFTSRGEAKKAMDISEIRTPEEMTGLTVNINKYTKYSATNMPI